MMFTRATGWLVATATSIAVDGQHAKDIPTQLVAAAQMFATAGATRPARQAVAAPCVLQPHEAMKLARWCIGATPGKP